VRLPQWLRPSPVHAALLALVLFSVGLQSYLTTRARLVSELRRTLESACALAEESLVRHPPMQAELSARVVELAALCSVRVEALSPTGMVEGTSEETLSSTDQSHEPEVVTALSTGFGVAQRRVVPHQPARLFVARYRPEGRWLVRLSAPFDPIAGTSLRDAGVAMAAGCPAAVALLGLLSWRQRAMARSVGVLRDRVEAIGSALGPPGRDPAIASELHSLADACSASGQRLWQSHRELKDIASGLTTVLDQMADGVLLLSSDQSIQVINPAAAAMLGTDRRLAVGRPLVEATLDFDLAELVRRALRTGILVEDRPRPSDDGARVVSAAAKPLAGHAGESAGIVITLRDVTQAHRFQQARQDFVANASHELRTPLAAIAAMAETLQDGAADDPEARERFLTRIIDNTRSMTHLVDDMMALAKLEENTPSEPEARPLDVREALAAAASRLEPQATAGGVSITVDAPDGMHVWCSEDDLTAALVNLVDNAVKYSPDGAEVRLDAMRSGEMVRIDVTDHGPGIPEKCRERVFERFYRVDKGRSRLLGGTGLGLSIVRHAIERNGGRVWVESPEHEGSRFVVLLPAVHPSAPCAP